MVILNNLVLIYYLIIDILKISDFGLATIFCHEGKERLLDKKCGTWPYVAPEVFNTKYRFSNKLHKFIFIIIIIFLVAHQLIFGQLE